MNEEVMELESKAGLADNGLRIELRDGTTVENSSAPLSLVLCSVGNERIHTTLWWNLRFIVRNAEDGSIVQPANGPRLPCGMCEDGTIVEPHGEFVKEQYLGCTQPAGMVEEVGWSYDSLLEKGKTYSITAVFQYPPVHNYFDSRLDQGHWRGTAVSLPLNFNAKD